VERLLRLRTDLAAWLTKLSPRERMMVSAAALAVFLFVAFLVSTRLASGIASREQRVEEKTRVLSQIGKLAEGYRQRQSERTALESKLKGPPVQLLSYISQQGAGMKIDVGDLRPVNAPGDLEGLKEDSVEVNLAKVELGTLARFLQALERGQGVVRVRRLRLTSRADDPRQVDATFTVSTYQLKT
jgi:general secretion pathway protein M